MRITRLRVRNLRVHHDLDLRLAPGMTVIRGPNEAGKSTVQRAIELALTRRVTSGGADLDALRSWESRADARPAITVEFEHEDEDGLRKGRLEKAFKGPKGTVILELDGQVITDPARADELLADLTGIPSEAFFRSTASVRHHELSEVQRDEGALRDRLQASISGADRGTSRAKRKLERAIHELNTRGPKNPGRLKVLEDLVATETTEVARGELALAQLERDRDALAAARERRLDTEASLVERRALLEKARLAERLIAERQAALEKYERFRHAVEIHEELNVLADSHPSANPLPVLRQIVGRLRELDATIRELKAALAGEVEVRFEVPPEPTWRPLARVAIALVVFGVLLAIAGVAAQFLNVINLGSLPAQLGGIAAGIGFILAFVALWLRRRDSLQQRLRDVEIDRRLRGRSQMEEELRLAEADTVQQLESIGLEDLAEAEDLLAREEEHAAKIDRLEAQAEGLVGKEPPEALPGLRDAAALEIEQKNSALEALGPIGREPRARERLEVEVRDAEASLERARDDEANSRARVEANNVDAEEVAAHVERLATARDDLAAVQRRARIYEETLRSIQHAEQATMKTATRFLEKRMVGDVARVTNGRYRYVKVDDRTLDISVRSPEKRDWVSVSSLSQGTLDLVYLAARIGLVRLVTGDRRPPLVFDDPFVTLDDERAGRALELLRELASDFQVIYLTTSSRYDEVADAVVELPGPTAFDTLPAPAEEPAPAHA